MKTVKDSPTPRREWGESAALVVALALFIGLPNRYSIGGTFATIALGVFLGAAVVLSLPFTIAAYGKWSRVVMLAAATVLAVARREYSDAKARRSRVVL